MINQEKIVNAATACFILKGFHATSMRNIAKQAGVSLGNIYNHFESKTDLVLAIAKEEMRDIKALKTHFGESKKGALPDILQLANYLLKDLCQLGVSVLTLEIAAEAARNPAIDKAFSENRRHVTNIVKAILTAGQKDGEVSNDINLVQASMFVLELVEGLALRNPGKGKLPPKKARQELTLILTKYLEV